MAGIKISGLPAAPAAALTDIYPIVQGGVTYSLTTAQLATLLGLSGGILSLASGGTGASLVASNGGIFYSTATAGAILSGTATANQALLSGASSAPSWSTTTYPITTTVNQLLYSPSTNTIAGLATGNSGALVTSAGGVPSISSVLPAMTTSDPITPQGVATKNYVDNIATGAGTPVIAASTAALTVTQAGAGVGATLTNAGVQAVFSLDGQSPTVGQRVLIKNQASLSQNGVYTVTNVGSGATNWVLTRATDYDTVADINATGMIPVQSGTVNANTGWINTTVMVTVDTTAITFVQFGVSFPVSVANGGTGLTTLTSFALLTGGTTPTGNVQQVAVGTSGQILQSRGSALLPSYSTSTYPTTNAINSMLYASAANVMSQLLTANSSVLVTSAGGVPSFSTSLPGNLTIPSPLIDTGLKDTNGNFWLIISPTASAVNYLTMQNATTGNTPSITANGSDTNVALLLQGQGNKGVNLKGYTDASNAAAGIVGEFVTSNILFASATSLTTGTPKNVTSISLSAGDWDIHGNVKFSGLGVTGLVYSSWTSITSATAVDASLSNAVNIVVTAGNIVAGIETPFLRVSVSATTTVYLTALGSFSAGTVVAAGSIFARRVR
jgi:hypothetical protein